MHTSQSGEWKILTVPSMENFDGLALQGSHTIYHTIPHTLPHTTSLQGSHAWGVFARRLVELYPDRLRAIQHLGWRERAGKVMLSFENIYFFHKVFRWFVPLLSGESSALKHRT